MNHLSKTNQHGAFTFNANQVNFVLADEADVGQRIDNFLAKILKGVPKSHIYRILRSGEVRVNSHRVQTTYRLCDGDQVRIPPIRIAATAQPQETKLAHVRPILQQTVIYEDEVLLVLNKPAGMAVHGGSGVSRGVIEQLRLERPQARYLELVHRLDKETSGILLVAKKRSALTRIHEAMRQNQIEKRYWMLVAGRWADAKRRVKLQLEKTLNKDGERHVRVVDDGQMSETVFYLKQRFTDSSLLEAQLITGRTHQLRVQTAYLEHPILGDEKYGDFALNKTLQKSGLKRMFLHSCHTELMHPQTGERLVLDAPLPAELAQYLQSQQAIS